MVTRQATCAGKVPYVTFSDALYALNAIRKRGKAVREEGYPKGSKLTPYRCPHCGLYFLGTQFGRPTTRPQQALNSGEWME